MESSMQNIRTFISRFMSAISNCSLYSREHASVEDLVKKSHEAFLKIPLEEEELELMVIENGLVVNKNPIQEADFHVKNLVRTFKRKGISRVDLLKGLTTQELKQFVIDLSDRNAQLKTLPHIKTGVIDVRLGGLKVGEDIDLDQVGLSHLTEEQVEKMKEIYDNLSPFKQLSITGLEEIVVNFIATFRREANILKLVSPVRSYSEYTYTHATNVSVLSMFQAECLGVSDDLLHDIGIAGLLHDVGKLFISQEILEKKGKLDDKEWDEIRKHTIYGARYLAKCDELTPLATLAALEHHLRYDGKGYPDLTVRERKQHIISQIISLADFFDALRSKRPYRKDLSATDVLSMMKKNAGNEFNPLLVDNFTKNLLVATKSA
jgi:HD-GYP domain-containing protein (c-di-GMP phosphodiesterase class II)